MRSGSFVLRKAYSPANDIVCATAQVRRQTARRLIVNQRGLKPRL